MIAAPDFKIQFNSAQSGLSKIERHSMIKPNKADTDRAVASIRVWKTYLPQVCVAAMIKDGWQWST
jgi:hypothetical protein